MILGIDGSNIRRGGGVTHLIELLRAAEPPTHGFSSVIVWSGAATLDRIADRPWLVKRHDPTLDGGLLRRALWQRRRLSVLARDAGCDALFCPGGSFDGSFRPVITISQNLLPFEWRELRRYRWSAMTLKFATLRLVQSRTFRHAAGVIFLTRYARDTVMRVIGRMSGITTTIPHGVDERFMHPPRHQLPIGHYSPSRPFRILYVSIVDVYKHQWHAAQAVRRLREAGYPVVLELIGPAYPPSLDRLNAVLASLGPHAEAVQYSGPVSYDELHARYAHADMFLFASSCENLPNILVEAMASGLPIACSDRGPMPEVLGDAGAYFDPTDSLDIARALTQLVESPELRAMNAQRSFERARSFSWRRCADESFTFFAHVTAAARAEA